MHVIGTAGHVDHGKSALVRRLTGIDPDRLTEEKTRGLTIDLGFAWLTTPSGNEVGIVDVPGHERFIKNMLAGAGGISVCLFVVAANEGWMPQSAEHLAALDVLGVRHGVVALTKADLVDDETIALVTAEIEERLAPTTMRGSSIVACSARDGRGISELPAVLDEVLATAEPAPDEDRPRLWVDRAFTISGAGTVVTGTLMKGALRTGDEVTILPSDKRVHVRGIQSHKRRVDEVGPGNRVALNLAGVALDSVERGDAVVKPGQWRTTTRVDALVRVVPEDVIGVPHTLDDRGAHLFYCGSAETPVRLSLLDAKELGPGESGYARLWLRSPLALARGDAFVLRDSGRVLTFGGGIILDPLSPAKRRKRQRGSLDQLGAASSQEALKILVELEGEIDAEEAFLRSGARTSPGVTELGSRLFSTTRIQELGERALVIVGKWHEDHPLERGLPRETLRGDLRLGAREFDALLEHIDGLEEDGAVIRLASFSVTLDETEDEIRKELLDKLEAAGFMPPSSAELGASPQLLRALVTAQELVDIGGFYLTADQARRAQKTVRAEIEKRGPLTVAEIRDLLGTTRKYAVPLCEWLDRTGATVRKGDVRLLGPND